MTQIKANIQEYFKDGINLKMHQVLDQENIGGVFLFGLMKADKNTEIYNPVIVISENITNREAFVTDFFNLLSRHGVNMGELKNE